MVHSHIVAGYVSLMPVLDILRSSLYDSHLLPILQL